MRALVVFLAACSVDAPIARERTTDASVDVGFDAGGADAPIDARTDPSLEVDGGCGTACIDGDGCCPESCDVLMDDDCTCRELHAWPDEWVALEEDLLVRINAERSMGSDCETARPIARTVVSAPELRVAARCHSLDMAVNDFLSHTGSDGSNPDTRADDAGYRGMSGLETLAVGTRTVDRTIEMWMAGGTCNVLMDDAYDEVGIGYAFRAGTRFESHFTAAFGTR